MERGMPIDDIVWCEVMATPLLSGDLPEMYAYIERIERYIGRRITKIQAKKSYTEQFYNTYKKGSRKGQIYGFPYILGPWCNSRLKVEALETQMKTYGTHVINYIGIAADEPKRLARLKPHQRAPLYDWGMTEKDAKQFLMKRNLLNPLYEKYDRLGCWFCNKQPLKSLRNLRHDYPEYWNILLSLQYDCDLPFRPNTTMFDLEAMFAQEDLCERRH